MAFVDGTPGNDLITKFTVPGTTGSADNVFADDGNDTVRGAAGNDTIDGWNGDDFLVGNGGNDFILGFNGRDKLLGGAGNDELLGEAGKDTLKGGAGEDTLNGGGGNDFLVGGNGADDFLIASPSDGVDKIKDFDFLEGDKVVIDSFGFGTTDVNDFTSTFNAGTGVEKLFFTPAGGGSTLIAKLTNLGFDSDFIPSLDIDFI